MYCPYFAIIEPLHLILFWYFAVPLGWNPHMLHHQGALWANCWEAYLLSLVVSLIYVTHSGKPPLNVILI